MKKSQEFVVGKHNIGWINDKFLSDFSEDFEMKDFPAFQKLPRAMNDFDIEKELNPGFCELGDILAFMDNATEELKDNKWNLFYTPSFVVRVGWRGVDWRVGAWGRGDDGWYVDFRVFSAVNRKETGLASGSPLGSLDPLNLAIETVKKAGYKVIKEL